MKTFANILILVSILLTQSCLQQPQLPAVKHVILIGLDGVGSYGFQRAHTPFMNEMASNGALSLKARCVLESSSSQNWMSMLTGAIPIQHGVTSNDWEPDNHAIDPILRNKKGFFPSIFDDIKTQKPATRVYMFYEWDGLGRMFDLSVPDKVVHVKDGEKIMTGAIESFFADRPDFLFVDIDETDHAGHEYGHESQGYFDCITKYDRLIGGLVDRLKKEKLLESTVILITGDHGGLSHGHGGETPMEMEIPVLMYGGSVTKGKIMERSNIIADIAPTVAGLLGIRMPEECVGKFIGEAFEPKSDISYAPIPVISPVSGFYREAVQVSIKADAPEAKIYYTLDNSEPSGQSTLYEKPFPISSTTTIKAVTIVGHTLGKTETTAIRIPEKSLVPSVKYSYYENYNGKKVPDFKTLGKPDRQGSLYEFSLNELNLTGKDHFAVTMESRLAIDAPGQYWFTLASDDGAKLFIDGKLVADNDGSHSLQKKKGLAELNTGLHTIRVEYFDDTVAESLELWYESDAVKRVILPCSKLSR